MKARALYVAKAESIGLPCSLTLCFLSMCLMSPRLFAPDRRRVVFFIATTKYFLQVTSKLPLQFQVSAAGADLTLLFSNISYNLEIQHILA